MTAASGRLGHALLGELSALAGAGAVVAVARNPARVTMAGPEKRAGDYQSVDGMAAALTGTHTAVIISAPVVNGSDRVALHRNVIAAARLAGVRRLLFTSVIGNGREAGTWFEPTQQVNRQAEEDLKNSGLEWLIARNGLYLELDCLQMLKARDTGVYTNPGGAGRCGYITIDELAYALARMATGAARAGRSYNLVGECLPQAELVALANWTFGMNLDYTTITDGECMEKFRRLMPERGETVARMLTGAFQCIRAGAFDVPSDFAAAAGRPARGMVEMFEDCRRKFAAV